MVFNPAFADSIGQIESGGNYGILGPVTKSGDRAYGKYQVMGQNIPQWTKEVLGVSMTPQQFLSNPQAQDQVFAAKFGQYADKYGPEGAAQAWFGGPGAVGKTDRADLLGTTVGHYGEEFMKNLAAPPLPPPITVGSLPVTPFGGQQPAQQKPLPPQPLNLAGAAPAAPMQMPSDLKPPVLNAPQLAPLIRQFNSMAAFNRIPLPAGFKGFSYT